MKTGLVGQFRWLESTDSDFLKILRLSPEVLIGKCVVISCFDSGPLRATEEEIAKGWQQQGDLVIVPCVDSISDLPYDNYDEWYVFSEETNPEIPDVFVNECLTLRSQESLVAEAVAAMGPQTDIVGVKYFASVSEERQLQFWDQLDRISPESYIGAGDQLVFVSRNAHLFDLVLRALS
jgi:hypothetical protein